MLASILTSFLQNLNLTSSSRWKLTTCVDCISLPFSPPYLCRILIPVQWVAGWCHIALWQMLSLVPHFLLGFLLISTEALWHLQGPWTTDPWFIAMLCKLSKTYPGHLANTAPSLLKISKNIKLFKVLLCKKQTGLKATHPSPSLPQNTQTHM